MLRNAKTRQLDALIAATTQHSISCRCASTFNRDLLRPTNPSTSRRDDAPPHGRPMRRDDTPARPRQPRRDDSAPPAGRSRSPQVHRSKHYNPAKQTGETGSEKEKILLEPHVLSNRLLKLCQAGKLDDAINMLKNSPRDAQNAVVWNTMIWECMKAAQYQLAYKLYTDMKRRGFSPTTRTYHTMFNGLSRITDWSTHAKQLNNAHALYESFQRHLDSLQKHSPDSKQLDVTPLTAYFNILGNARLHDKMFEIYYTLPKEGPLAPDQFLYAVMFKGLAPPKENETISVPALHQQASTAKLLWSFVVKASEKSGFPIDSHVVTGAIHAMSYGRAPDQESALRLASDYYDLAFLQAPVVLPSPLRQNTLPLERQPLQVILELCRACRRYKDSMGIMSQALNKGLTMDRLHLEEVLKSHLALSAKDPSTAAGTVKLFSNILQKASKTANGFYPPRSVYMIGLTVCWKSADWMAARQIFQFLTGYSTHSFVDGANNSREPKWSRDINQRAVAPDAETISLMLRIALASKNPAYMREAERLAYYMTRAHKLLRVDRSKTGGKDDKFYPVKLAQAIVETGEKLLSNMGKNAVEDEVRKWQAFMTEARGYLQEVGDQNVTSFKKSLGGRKGKSKSRDSDDYDSEGEPTSTAYEKSLLLS